MEVGQPKEEAEDSSSSSSSSSDDSDDDDSSSNDSTSGVADKGTSRGADPGNPGFEEDMDMKADGAEDDEDHNAELLAQLSETNYKLSGDPYSYELYVEKIQLLSRLGDADALHETREKLSQLYPLSEKLWLDWVHDEIGLISNSEDRVKVYQLFDRAVKDYLSIDIWLEYVQFQLGEIAKPGGIEKCRQLFERALSSGGLHVPMGSVLWDTYREFEGAVLGMTEEAKLEEQEQRYISICKRQLGVPLFGLENTFKQLKSKIEIDSATEANYKIALEKLKSITMWEDKLADENVQHKSKSEIYKEYLEAEKTAKSNPVRRICLYERAVTDCPLDGLLWVDFYEYTLGIHLDEMSLDVIIRASRNCPWTMNIWTYYLCHIEQQGGTQEQLKEIFEKAILYHTTGEQAGTLWLKYLEVLRRRIDVSNPKETDISLFNKTSEAAEQHLRQLLEEPNDFVCQILLFQVRTKIHLAKSVESSKDLWVDIYKRGYGSKFNVWLQSLILEKEYGVGIKELRKKYEKGLASVKDYPPLVVDLWLNFERDYGDIKSLRSCESKIEKWMKRTQIENENMQVENFNAPSYNNNRREGFGFKRQRFGQQDQVPGKQGKYDAPEKKFRAKPFEDRPDGGDFKKPFPPKQDKPYSKIKKEIPIPASTAPGFADEYQPEQWKLDPKDNNRTVFVSNLDVSTDEVGLREFFTSSGVIETIRIAKNFKGVSKRYGYVCFSTIEEAQKALGKDRELLGVRPIFVSKCDTDKTTRTSAVKFRTGLERDKLFVKGVPVTTKVEEVRQLFEQYSKVKECRLVTYRNGESKGLAYVDFFDDDGARLALSKTDGLEFQGSSLCVAFSNPPRKQSKDDEEFSGPSVRRAPTMFVPRALQISTKPEEKSSISTEKKGSLNNQDFRKLFQK